MSTSKSGLLLLAHGSHRNPDAASPAFAHADRIRAADVFETVRVAFWKEEPSFSEALRTVHTAEVYAVPLFVSEGYFTEEVIPRELRLDGWSPDAWESDGLDATAATFTAGDTGQTVHYCGPIGTHDSMTDVIIRRAQSVTGNDDIGPGVGLAVVGHGTKRNENSAKAVSYHADRVQDRDRFDEVRALFLDEDPAIDTLSSQFDSDDIVVVPLFIADGYHTREDIPEDIGLPLTDDGYESPATVGGQTLWYAGAVGTEPLAASVVLERTRDAGAQIAASPLPF